MAEETCPRCGVNPAGLGTSRLDSKTHICSSCNTSEAMEDFMAGAITPMEEWPIKPKAEAPKAPGEEEGITCKHCKTRLSWDAPFAEWFHTARVETGEYAIFCAGTSGPMAEA